MACPVEALYEAFRAYRLGDDFYGCPHCGPAEKSRHLAGTPRKQLTAEALEEYLPRAMTTWGTQRHFKYFLPRLLELAYAGSLGPECFGTIADKLLYARWSRWPEPERRCVKRFLHAFWSRQLHTPGEFPHEERVFLVAWPLGEACGSLGPFLEYWSGQSELLPALHLAQFVENLAWELSFRKPGVPPALAAEVAKWLEDALPRRLLARHDAEVAALFPGWEEKLAAASKGLAGGNAAP